MKGFVWLLASLLASSPVFAAEVPPDVAGAVTHEAARAQVGAATPKQGPTEAPQQAAAGQKTINYLDVLVGLGLTEVITGKSRLGISPTETDWVAQRHNNWKIRDGRVGVGYIYSLSGEDRFEEKFQWFPWIYPVLTLNYYNLYAKGNVLLFNNPAFRTVSFDMPIRTTSLMLDVALSLLSYQHFSFFVLGGVGEAYSDITYSDGANPNTAILRPPLTLNSKSQHNAVYEWGGGASLALCPRVVVSLEYLYTHFGNFRTSVYGNLGGVPTQLVSPANFSLRTQTVMFDLHWAVY